MLQLRLIFSHGYLYLYDQIKVDLVEPDRTQAC